MMEGTFKCFSGDDIVNEGLFTMHQSFKESGRLTTNVTVEYKQDKSKSLKSNMRINLKTMELESTDSEDRLFFGSIGHLDNAQLKFFIKEEDALFIKHGKEAYIQAKLTSIEDEEVTGNGDGYVETELFLY